jgi:hypothetical protein
VPGDVVRRRVAAQGTTDIVLPVDDIHYQHDHWRVDPAVRGALPYGTVGPLGHSRPSFGRSQGSPLWSVARSVARSYPPEGRTTLLPMCTHTRQKSFCASWFLHGPLPLWTGPQRLRSDPRGSSWLIKPLSAAGYGTRGGESRRGNDPADVALVACRGAPATP